MLSRVGFWSRLSDFVKKKLLKNTMHLKNDPKTMFGMKKMYMVKNVRVLIRF